MNWRYVVAGWLARFFYRDPSRPPSNKSPVKDIATAILTFIRAVDRANGDFGFAAVANVSKHFDPGGSVVETQRQGKPLVIFEPSSALADFRFEFWVDHMDGQVGFSVLGNLRYEGFSLAS